jgi:CARDB
MRQLRFRLAGRSIVVMAAVAALATTCAPAWAGASPSPGTGAVVTGRVTAGVTACHVAGDLAARYATFAAEMTATATTQQMSLRLQLYEHTPGTPGYHLVTGVPGFGVWERSAPGVSIFDYSQEVTHLVAPASFRVQVGYRWMDSGHHVIKRATRTTVSCAQPTQLANLAAGAVSVTPGVVAGTATYDVTVRNDGPVAAGPFTVGLSINGVAVTNQRVAGLSPQTRTAVEFSGPACGSTGTLTVVVDPANAVGESTKADNTRTVACS